jgi:hypothetical protein
LHLLHKLHGYNWLHVSIGDDRRRKGRECRKRITGDKCLCRNELRVGKAGGSIGFASLGAGHPAKRVHLGGQVSCMVRTVLDLGQAVAPTSRPARRLLP